MNAILDAIGAALKVANAVLSVIPALLWAVALALALAWVGFEKHEVSVAEKAKVEALAKRDDAIGQKNQVLAQLEQQKKDAKARYDALKAANDALQQRANEQHAQQEKRDANSKAVIDDQARRLRELAAAHGGQLRDPNATGCRRGGGGPEGQAAADPGNRAADPAETGGLLSAQLSGLLERILGEADTINRAYDAARADTLMCRGAVP